jgi:RNA-directed DNA polymerase
VLCQHHAQPALAIIRRWFTTMGLELNEQKTAVKQARTESFDFLGYTFRASRSNGVKSNDPSL